MKQNKIVECRHEDGVLITIVEGLNVKTNYEVILTIPSNLQKTFEETPSLFEKWSIDDTTLYFGVNTKGVVRRFAYRGPSTGFGGARIEVNTVDGKEILIGPWSSRCGVMNHVFQASMEVVLETKYRLASAMTFAALNKYVRLCGFTCDMRQEVEDGDWSPYLRPIVESFTLN